MKYAMALLSLLVFSSCMTVPADYQNLRDRVAVLEKVKLKSPADAMLLAEQAGARKFWWVNDLSGGTSADLNGIAAASLTDGDAAIVAYKTGETTTLYFYIYDDNSATATSSPTVIKPNPSLGGEQAGAWFLANLQTVTVTGNSADGSHYIDVGNSGYLDVGDRAEGRCWFNEGDGHLECYHNSTIYHWDADGTH